MSRHKMKLIHLPNFTFYASQQLILFPARVSLSSWRLINQQTMPELFVCCRAARQTQLIKALVVFALKKLTFTVTRKKTWYWVICSSAQSNTCLHLPDKIFRIMAVCIVGTNVGSSHKTSQAALSFIYLSITIDMEVQEHVYFSEEKSVTFLFMLNLRFLTLALLAVSSPGTGLHGGRCFCPHCAVICQHCVILCVNHVNKGKLLTFRTCFIDIVYHVL